MATMAQVRAQVPTIVEAETGTLGSSLTTGTDASNNVTYITVLPAANTGNPPTPDRIATYQVSFPAAGSYALYARILAGPVGGNDDSFYIPAGFNDSTNWTGLYNTSIGGATAPGAGVSTTGGAGQNVWKWVRLTGIPAIGDPSVGPTAWVVPEGALMQSFSWASREDGLLFDKLAFAPVDLCYTVGDLDAVRAPTVSCPPPQPVPAAYTRPSGSPLAAGQSKYLGSAHSPAPADPAQTNPSLNFAAYWNQVTPENGGKWGSAQPTSPFGPAADGYPTLPSPQFNWAAARAAYQQARSAGIAFKWHTLFWGNQQPVWIESLPVAKQQEAIRIWLSAIAAEFPDLEQIEVVNEPLHDPPRGPSNGNYIEALGGNGVTGWDWIINAFTLAREYFPNAKLVLNDYSITNDGNATTNYLTIVNLLKNRGLIDHIGIQGHAFEFNYNNLAGSAATHRANLARLAATGLPIYVTEFDIDGADSVWGLPDDVAQTQRFQALFPVFWESEAVKGVTLWGYMRGAHWRTGTGAWLMYTNGAERPALQWLVRYVENKRAVVSAGQSFSVNENAPAGSAVGTVLATDADAGTTLSQWQIDSDPSGKFAIDAATGTVSLATGASLDFEATTAYEISVSVWDGYNRSVPGAVTINVTNLNDNTPSVSAGQTFDIDGGYRNSIGWLESSDPDDMNQLGFTTFQGWQIVSGNTSSVFRLTPSAGELKVARPLLIDWRKTSYTLGTTVSDGTHTSAATAVTVVIPKRVDMCLLDVIKLEVPKATAPLVFLLGGDLGSCFKPR
jgi:endo-1,4-beta-xylanase